MTTAATIRSLRMAPRVTLAAGAQPSCPVGYRVPACDCYSSGMTVKANFHPAAEGGFWAKVPALPGCVTQGESIDEIRLHLREAVEGWLHAGESTDGMAEADQILELPSGRTSIENDHNG